MSRLFVVAVVLAEVGGFQLFRGHGGAKRHQAHIDKVGAARTAEVGMGEAIDNILVVVIARAWVPSDHLLRLRTQLHHALRHRGTWEGAAAEGTCLIGLCADEGIDILGVVVGALSA